ncbi:nuclease [Cronobacter malonaticus]|uniref:nuclease n=1 Tax=Cronobacter malonaticus TaxID=413503 RepID=UPI000CFCCB7A|nr:nuclease [Cronobacter malonaticus]EKY3230863.1 nuclease [Cronobacter malonaticus]ELY4025700.1 nuclease [Cronobacter malonaticus]MDI7684264.1 nuclease [Cronobacter malonaticus]
MLLTLLDIENKLHLKFAIFQGEMDDLILKKRNGPPDNLAKLDSELNIKICDDFLSFVNTYDLDNFSLGNVAFGSGENYINTVIELNKNNGFNKWWAGNKRPEGVIVIATSDPYGILLNNYDHKVYGITGETYQYQENEISKSFELFVRGVGTLFLKEGTASEVAVAVGAVNQDFWLSL